jgi:hypothetical protein
MSAIRGIIHDGKVVFATPPGWPDGAVVDVELAREEERIGISEDEQGDEPESIARWLAWVDQIQPLVMTPEEEAEWQKARAEHKEWELANWEAHSKKLEDLFK